MANLKEVRDRIVSVKNTQQITKAMKMVSAAKLRRAQDAITQMRPYANKLDSMLRNILSNLEGDAGTVFGQERPVERACIVVVTSNRGLCGAFNTNVIKAALAAMEGKFADVHARGNLTESSGGAPSRGRIVPGLGPLPRAAPLHASAASSRPDQPRDATRRQWRRATAVPPYSTTTTNHLARRRSQTMSRPARGVRGAPTA